MSVRRSGFLCDAGIVADGMTTEEREELAQFRRRTGGCARMSNPQADLRPTSRQGEPVNVYLFIEVEKQGDHTVKRAWELL